MCFKAPKAFYFFKVCPLETCKMLRLFGLVFGRLLMRDAARWSDKTIPNVKNWAKMCQFCGIRLTQLELNLKRGIP